MMIFKVSRGGNCWTVIDNLKHIDYGNCHTVSSSEELTALIDRLSNSNEAKTQDFLTNRPNSSGNFKFQSATLERADGSKILVLFNRQAYLTNDVGDTIERIKA